MLPDITGEVRMYLYRMIETRESIFGRVSYGILSRCIENGAMKDFSMIPGISDNREFVRRLLDRCKEQQLEPLDMLSAVMDSLP